MDNITSPSNPAVKYVRRLQAERRFREREGSYVVEGTRWIAELLKKRQTPQELYYTMEWARQQEHMHILTNLEGPRRQVSKQVMAVMSDTQTPAGVLAVIPLQPLPLPSQPDLLLILDRIRTPGNLGTICRTAAAAGVDGVLLAPGCVDFYNPKVVRGGMGAHLRLPVHAVDWIEIEQQTSEMKIWLAHNEGKYIYSEVNWRQPSALIIGSEASGASETAERLATGRVAIPLHAKIESLNAAIATGVILFEAARQRSFMY